MHSIALDNQLGELNQWKGRLKKTIIEYYAWLKKHHLLSAETEEQVRAGIHALNTDELTVALVAEFSRGKTNLINAIFFADYGQQLLPSAAGRTTMCPVEMFHDGREGPYLRVLPIDTLRQQRSLSSFKDEPAAWTHFPLPLEQPERLKQILLEVKFTRRVTLAEAHGFGLALQDDPTDPVPETELVEIPKWRHALLNFPHPLMKKGLRVVDTPGLNALGSEPELIFSLLPAAQVILFVLAADTGVTSSDLKIWKNHIRSVREQRNQGVIVALNKIDTLWDELLTEDEVQATIERQRGVTAALLELPQSSIFTVSAHKALVAKIRNDPGLLERSGLPVLEDYLSRDLLASRRNTLIETLCANFGHRIENSIRLLQGKLDGMLAQRHELFELSGKSNAMIDDLLDETMVQKRRHLVQVNELMQGQKQLQAKAEQLAAALSVAPVDDIIGQTHQRMQGNWTTAGLKRSMQDLFDQLNRRMMAATGQVEEARDLLQSIYRRFEVAQGFRLVQPRIFSVLRYRVQLDRLYQEAEAFRNSAATALSGKNTVIQRFFTALADQARLLFATAAEDAGGNWVRLALEPLKYQIRDQRDMLDRKASDLNKIAESRDTLTVKIKELHRSIKRLKVELERLRELQASINALAASRQRALGPETSG